MKRVFWITPATLAIVGTAAAQAPQQHPFAVRGGFSYLTDKDARSATSNGGWTAGIGYDLPMNGTYGMTPGSKLSFDIDFDSHRGNGNKLETTAFQLVFRSPFSNGMPKSNAMGFYWGVGLGLFHHSASTTSTTTVVQSSGQSTTTTSTNSSTKNVFGGSLLLGANLANNMSLELFYRISSPIDGNRADTLGISFGIHF